MAKGFMGLGLIVASAAACGGARSFTPTEDVAAGPRDASAADAGAEVGALTIGGGRALPFLKGDFVNDASSVYGAMASLCSEAGGRFEIDECVCPDPSASFRLKSLVLERRSAGGLCLRATSRTATGTPFRDILAKQGPRGLEVALAGLSQAATVLVGGDTDESKSAAAQGLAARADELGLSTPRLAVGGPHAAAFDKAYPDNGLGYRFSDQRLVYVGAPSSAQVEELVSGALRGLTEDVPTTEPFSPMRLRNVFGTVEPDPALLDRALGILGTAGSPPPFESPEGHEALAAGLAASARAVINAFAVVPSRFRASRRRILVGDDCTFGICRLFSPNIALGEGFYLVRDRVYALGTLTRETLWVHQDGALRGLVVLGPNKGPGLVVLARTELAPQRAGLELHVFDRRWTSLGVLSAIEAVDLQNLTSAADEAYDQLPGRGIVVCDSGFRRAMEQWDVASYVAVGPNLLHFSPTGTFDGGSLFGWRMTSTEHPSVSDVMDGAFWSDWGFFVRDEERRLLGNDDHAARVVRAARSAVENTNDRDSLRFLPVSYPRCFDVGSLDPELRRAAKVVNASFESVVDQAAHCSSGEDEALRRTEGELLWVFAAGNDGLTNPPWRCPAGAAAGRPNAIVVGALGEDGRVAQTSNRGTTFVDIVASGRDVSPDAVPLAQTSFAAPQVSASAALLSRKLPLLPPAWVRAAILVGGRVRDDLKPLVRSGAELDYRRARSLATCLQHVGFGPGSSPEPSLRDAVLRCTSPSPPRSSTFTYDSSWVRTLLDERALLSTP